MDYPEKEDNEAVGAENVLDESVEQGGELEESPLDPSDVEQASDVRASKLESITARARRAFNLGRQFSESKEAEYNDAESEDSDIDASAAFEEIVDAEAEEEIEGEAIAEAESVQSEDLQNEEDGPSVLDQLKQEADENFDKYLRAVAELENYKKRATRERADLLRYAGEHLARDLLDILDDLERALSQENQAVDDLLAGVQMIYERFVSVLARHQITAEDAVGSEFDPKKHDALATVPTTEVKAGVVIEQLKKPYLFKDKLLRAGQVVVSAAVAEDAD